MLILLLIALAATLRLFFCAPAQVAKRQKNTNDALLVWYRAAEDALLCMGLSSLPGEAPASFLWRAQCELHDAVKLTGQMCIRDSIQEKREIIGKKCKKSREKKRKKPFQKKKHVVE